MIRRLVLALAAVALAASARAAGPLLVSGSGMPLVWATIPVPFHPDRGTLGLLDNASAVAHVSADFGVWAAVQTAAISFTDAGALPVDVTDANYSLYLGRCGDGLSPIVFDTDGSITDDVFGAGASNSVLGFAGPECGSFFSATISEGSAVLNGKWIDGVSGPGNPEIPVAAFDAVFIHEFGHYVNLDHSQVNLLEAFDGNPSNDDAVATMFPILINAGAASSLHLDDRVSVSALYPSASFASGFGTITGSVRLPDGTSLFQGAYVIARRVGDPRLGAVAAASGARWFPLNAGGPPPAALEGRYEIPGLPPGSYTVEVEEIDGGFTGGSSVGPLDPPAVLPGPPEFWNGANEANASPPDDPGEAVPLSIAAGTVVSGIDIVLNGLTCPVTPLPGCRRPVVVAAASLQLKDSTPDLRDGVDWKWSAGEATAKIDFGDPVAGTAYQLCIYDQVAGVPGLVLGAAAPGGGTCRGKPCWREGSTGFRYTDPDLTPGGLAKIQLRAGETGRARIKLKGKGTALAMPALPLDQDGDVIVQLFNAAGTCWEATYPAPATVNDALRFKDRSD